MTNELVRVCWKIGFISGYGELMDHATAQAHIERLNKEYGAGTHWLETANGVRL